MIALDDRVVAAHRVEDLRPQADVADGADAVARLGDGDAVALARDLLERHEHLSCRAPATSAGALDGDPLERRLQLGRARRSSRAGRRRPPSARRRARASAALSAAVRSSASSIRSRILSSSALISVCAKADLVLDRVVFLVGLDGHRRLAELREAALLDGDVLLDRAAGVLVVGQPLLGGGDALARGLEPRVERLLVLGFVGERAAARRRRLSSLCRAMSRSRSAFMLVEKQKSPGTCAGFETGRPKRPAGARLGQPRRTICIIRNVHSSILQAYTSEKVGPPGFEPGTGRL